jgi:hypothetical protein
MSYNVGMAARTDVFKVSSALISQRLFEGKPMDDKLWVVSTALTVIGFVTYQLLLASWLDTSKLAKGAAKVAIDDILKFSTMFVVSRVLSSGAASETGGATMTQEEWVKDSGLFIASLVTYDLLLHDLVSARTAGLEGGVKTAVNDAVKMSVVFSVNNVLKGKEFDRAWFMTSAGFITGLVVYDLVVERYAGKYITEGTL